MSKNLPLAGRRVLMFVGDIYEDLELWYPKLRLIEAGARVVVAGPEAGRKYTGKNGYPCISDAVIAQMRAKDFDGVVVPGGFMPDHLRRDHHVLELVRDFAASGKLVATLWAAPMTASLASPWARAPPVAISTAPSPAEPTAATAGARPSPRA